MCKSSIIYHYVYIALLMSIVHCIPIKREIVDQLAAADCYGVDCSYDDPDFYEQDVIVNVNIPDNITDVIVNFIPEMMKRQEQQVTTILQNVTQIAQSQMGRQEKQITNLREEMNQLASSQMERQEHQVQIMINVMANMTDLLQSQLNLLNEIKPVFNRRDCQDVLAKKLSYGSGVYTITPRYDADSFQVFCDMVTDGGPWTVFQKRFEGSVDFYRNWVEYENGFGSVEGEYWLGLKHINALTQSDGWQLRIDMEAFDGDMAYALYDLFRVGNAASNYTLHVSGYSGSAGDSLTYHNGMAFSSKDRDNDAESNRHCAEVYKGGNWYKACHHSNLNGFYLGPSGDSSTGNRWLHWKRNKALKMTEMKMRRIS